MVCVCVCVCVEASLQAAPGPEIKQKLWVNA